MDYKNFEVYTIFMGDVVQQDVRSDWLDAKANPSIEKIDPVLLDVFDLRSFRVGESPGAIGQSSAKLAET
jgi:hypothetical protein